MELNIIENCDYYNCNAYLYLLYCCIRILIMYPIVHFVLKYNSLYNNYDYNKKCYIIKNIIKSIILCYISIDSVSLLFDAYNGRWDKSSLNQFASIYVSNDIMGLIIIPKLPTTTKFHHILSTILLLYSYTVNFTEDNVGRFLFILCIFSSFSFLVNFYLGARYLESKEDILLSKIINIIRLWGYYIYILCCLISWSTQTILLSIKLYNYELTLPYIIYTLVLIPIINDDLILMSWLRNKTLKVD
jgi:hypothetical protein